MVQNVCESNVKHMVTRMVTRRNVCLHDLKSKGETKAPKLRKPNWPIEQIAAFYLSTYWKFCGLQDSTCRYVCWCCYFFVLNSCAYIIWAMLIPICFTFIAQILMTDFVPKRIWVKYRSDCSYNESIFQIF